MATFTELAAYLGKEGLYHFDHSGFGVSVRIRDVKESWGRIQVRIYPKDGTGDKWVALDSVTLHEA